MLRVSGSNICLSAVLVTMALAPCSEGVQAQDGQLVAELVFPLRQDHNHAPSLVECPNGDLLCAWYRGSGERQADDVAVWGARLKHGSQQWSEAFLMADRKGFPDCNTAMMVDAQERLWLFWPTILANSWESCLTNFRVAEEYQAEGAPNWNREGVMWLKPKDFSDTARAELDRLVELQRAQISPKLLAEIEGVRELLGQKLYQRLGWQPRCKPTVLPSGRILLPLYSDTYSLSLMAISDDHGDSWFAGEPTLGFGAIQPSVVRRDDGTLVAYMRENGPHNRIRVAESNTEGLSWGPVTSSSLPNPGSGLDAVRLDNGHWVLVYNDSEEGPHDRSRLAVSLSLDEGQTWAATRHLELEETGAYHYPVVIQSRDERIHVVYSFFNQAGKSMKHASFDEAWLTQSTSP